MKLKGLILAVLASSALSACWVSPSTLVNGMVIRNNVAYDQGTMFQPGHPLADMIAGIWVDGNGCEHWIIDDGIEGYMTTRWGPDGKPYCPAGNVPYQTKGFERTHYFASSTATNGRANVPGQYTSINDSSNRINTGYGAPANIAGPAPFQEFVPDANINETYGLIPGY